MHALSLREYFSNSFVIALLILLAAVGQGSFSQSSSHLMTLAGMRAKNGLHVLLFEKALRLPMGARPPEKGTKVKMKFLLSDPYQTCFYIL